MKTTFSVVLVVLVPSQGLHISSHICTQLNGQSVRLTPGKVRLAGVPSREEM